MFYECNEYLLNLCFVRNVFYFCSLQEDILLAETHAYKFMKKFSFLILLLGVCILVSSTQKLDVERPASVNRYIQKYRYLSVELNKETGIPIPIIIAIAGLESNWGKSELATLANNHFGIKHKEEWTGWTYCKQTVEYEGWVPFVTEACFRKYPLIKESYTDFGRFVKTRPNYKHLQYAPSWNYRAWAEGLKTGGYATDPEYAEKILRIIWRYHLYDFA